MTFSFRKYCTVLSVPVLVALSATARSADLVDTLEKEAAQVSVDAATVNGSPSDVAGFHSDRYEQFMAQRQFVPAGLTQQQLKLFFFNEFFETYANYAELSKAQQKQVYQFYHQQQELIELSAINSKILELLPTN